MMVFDWAIGSGAVELTGRFDWGYGTYLVSAGEKV